MYHFADGVPDSQKSRGQLRFEWAMVGLLALMGAGVVGQCVAMLLQRLV